MSPTRRWKLLLSAQSVGFQLFLILIASLVRPPIRSEAIQAFSFLRHLGGSSFLWSWRCHVSTYSLIEAQRERRE